MIRLKKIGLSGDSYALPAAKWDSYVHGTLQNEGESLPIEYEIEGQLLGEIKVGYPVLIARSKRNGIEIGGFFQTSPVIGLTKGGFKTKNSEYIIEEI